MAHRTTSGTYDKVALAYEERIVPYYGEVARALVKMARLRGGDKILDVGAGTGIVARLSEPLIRPNGMVVLLDRAAPMLTIARGRMPRGKGAAAFVCVVEKSEAMSLASEQFDAVLGQFSYVEESPKAMHEVFRVLKPGGRLLLATWGPDRLHEEHHIRAAIRRAIGAPPLPPAVPVKRLLSQLKAAGFVDRRARQQFFRGIYADADSYVEYRDAFPWRTNYDRSLWPKYLSAVRDASLPYQDRRGRVIIRRSVTFISAQRPR